MPWSQGSFLFPPGACPSFLSRTGFRIATVQLFTLVDFASNYAPTSLNKRVHLLKGPGTTKADLTVYLAFGERIVYISTSL